MDKLITTRGQEFWHFEALSRDRWVKAHADRLPQGSVVLDAGAGASKYRPFFAHSDYKTQDFCLYDGALVKYLQPIDYGCDITQIPLPDHSLDAMFLFAVWLQSLVQLEDLTIDPDTDEALALQALEDRAEVTSFVACDWREQDHLSPFWELGDLFDNIEE